MTITDNAVLIEVLSKTSVTINLYASVIIFVFGVVGNTLNIFVLTQRTLRSAQHSIGILLAVTAWSITEIIRYGYYALNLFQTSPQLLTWCRYSFFIVLYPLGVTGELVTIVKAMRTIYPESVRNRYSILLPNKLNFGFDYFYFLVVVLLAYTYFPTMFKHMFTQRAKTLNPSSSSKKVN
ncbi:unnamed protein product [Adineta steineri]|uniref:Very-long-chain (3R)-3-hydroxyacyl-CoA dehydratase n=1 Tax=Adineta steineri TaxID=433720 RepID=A0A815ENP5_9BILA|nr:unnamed protein product [Adineta steineri]